MFFFKLIILILIIGKFFVFFFFEWLFSRLGWAMVFLVRMDLANFRLVL